MLSGAELLCTQVIHNLQHNLRAVSVQHTAESSASETRANELSLELARSQALMQAAAESHRAEMAMGRSEAEQVSCNLQAVHIELQALDKKREQQLMDARKEAEQAVAQKEAALTELQVQMMRVVELEVRGCALLECMYGGE